MPAKTTKRIYIANETFVATDQDGTPVTFKKNITRVREGHPMMKGREHFFRLETDDVHFDYDVEDATSDPGVRRGARETVAE